MRFSCGQARPPSFSSLSKEDKYGEINRMFFEFFVKRTFVSVYRTSSLGLLGHTTIESSESQVIKCLARTNIIFDSDCLCV